jgi:hypothetical protein
MTLLLSHPSLLFLLLLIFSGDSTARSRSSSFDAGSVAGGLSDGGLSDGNESDTSSTTGGDKSALASPAAGADKAEASSAAAAAAAAAAAGEPVAKKKWTDAELDEQLTVEVCWIILAFGDAYLLRFAFVISMRCLYFSISRSSAKAKP